MGQIGATIENLGLFGSSGDFTNPLQEAFTIEYGSSSGDVVFTVEDASNNVLAEVKKGAAAGADYGSVLIPGGDILNVINIQGGITGVSFNLNLGAGSAVSGDRGNVAVNYDVGCGFLVYDGSENLLLELNETSDGSTGTGEMTLNVPLNVNGIVSSNVDDVAAVWNAGASGAGHQWKTDNSAQIMGLDSAGNLDPAGRVYPGSEALAQQVSGGILHSTGVPSNANGSNNDWCISDNGHLYFKASGAWAQKV